MLKRMLCRKASTSFESAPLSGSLVDMDGKQAEQRAGERRLASDKPTRQRSKKSTQLPNNHINHIMTPATPLMLITHEFLCRADATGHSLLAALNTRQLNDAVELFTLPLASLVRANLFEQISKQ